MSLEMKLTLQSIINSMHNPAFIKKDNKIQLVNDAFERKGYSQNTYDKQAVENGCNIIEKPLHNNMKLCEIVDNELNVLEISRQKLTQAMRLF